MKRDPSAPLTPRQAEVLAFIVAFVTEHGYAPSLREIAAAIGTRSTNGITDHLNALERKGRISRDDVKSRALRVLAPPTLAEAAP